MCVCVCVCVCAATERETEYVKKQNLNGIDLSQMFAFFVQYVSIVLFVSGKSPRTDRKGRIHTGRHVLFITGNGFCHAHRNYRYAFFFFKKMIGHGVIRRMLTLMLNSILI